MLRMMLIDPSKYLEDGQLLKYKRSFFLPLTLPHLAALVPSNYQVQIVFEAFEDVNFAEPVDLVGITAHSFNIRRAYEIADEYRRRGVCVVMGGVHVSAVPDEAAEHADVVIVGEAEETWPIFLRDFARNEHKRTYHEPRKPSLTGLPVPRYEAVNKLSLFLGFGKGRHLVPATYFIQTSRGCPNLCGFCRAAWFNGGVMRFRPVAEVVDEIRALKAKWVLFIDDNLFVDPSRAKELFQALIPLRIHWTGLATINAARDKELLDLAKRSGCRQINIGLESLSEQTLKEMKKRVNQVSLYEHYLNEYRRAGIEPIVCIMLGYDNEPTTMMEETYRFLMRNRIAHLFLWPLIPYPGTPLYERYAQEGRLKSDRWWLDPNLSPRQDVLKHQPVGFDPDLFTTNFRRYYQKFYSTPSIVRRLLLPPQQRGLALKILFNFMFQRSVKRECVFDFIVGNQAAPK